METKPTDTQNNKPTVILSYYNIEQSIKATWPADQFGCMTKPRVWGVPRGGKHIVQILERMGLALSTTEKDADVIVDDLIDSGRTRTQYTTSWPEKDFWVPINNPSKWFVFPWETSREHDALHTITRYLQHIGEDPTREGLIDTPKRVVKSWKELYAGYNQSPKDVLGTVFSSENTSLVICKDIEFYSMCEHHMLPFFGKAHIGYIPHGKVVGLSKLARLVDVFARRLQIQEQLTDQIAHAIVDNIDGCADAMVVIEAKHHCMCARGVSKQSSSMITSAIIGEFKESELRQEFTSLIK